MFEHGYRAVCGGDVVGDLVVDLVVETEAVVEVDSESGWQAPVSNRRTGSAGGERMIRAQ